MKTGFRYTLLLLVISTWPGVAFSVPVIFACEPEWGALAKALADDQAEVYVATTAAQDPHFIEARPSLLAAARRADMLVCTGADLEAGWLPVLLRESANDRIQPGAVGHFMASDYVEKLDIPQRLDRSEGDVHAEGNPHVHLDPRNIAPVMRALASALREALPALAAGVSQRETAFQSRWEQALAGWTERAKPLKGIPVFVQHTNSRYLTAWLQLKVVGAIEPKPGIPPNAKHLASVVALHRALPAKMVLVAAYENPKPSQWLGDQVNIPVVAIPFTVGAEGADDLFALFDTTLARLGQAIHAHDGH